MAFPELQVDKVRPDSLGHQDSQGGLDSPEHLGKLEQLDSLDSLARWVQQVG